MYSHLGATEFIQIRHEELCKQIHHEISIGRGLSRWIKEEPPDVVALDSLLWAAARDCGIVVLRSERIALAESVDLLSAFLQVGVLRALCALYVDGQCDMGVLLIRAATEIVDQAKRQLKASKELLPVVPVWFLFSASTFESREGSEAREGARSANRALYSAT
jgi:hypothetical protein